MADQRAETERAIPESLELPVDWSRTTRVLLAVAVVSELTFLLLDYHVNFGNPDGIGALRRFTNLAREDGVGSWFGTIQTTMIALTLWALWLVARGRIGSTATPLERRGLAIMAAFYSYMVVDDGAQIHERIGTVFKTINRRDGTDDSLADALLAFFPSYTWQIVFLPMFSAFALFTLYWVWRHLDRKALLVTVAGFGCFVVAVGMDFVEGLDPDHRFNLYTIINNALELDAWTERRFDENAYDTLRHFSKAVEETIEMFGHTLLWSVFLRELGRVGRDVRVLFGGRRG